MIYTDFQDKKLSLLGFGAMRLPTLENGAIDEDQTRDMVRMAMDAGVNYFDTALPYHGGMSEIVLGKILREYPRDRWFLANKFPGHQIRSSYDPAEVFEAQLKKCGVDSFDFYLLHNVYENSIHTYKDPKWGILDYFKEQKRLGRIKHLGFSTHGRLGVMKEFLELYGQDMEFCQIQLNYLDWTLQDAKAKVALLNEWNLPIWVMEPVRGGKLCHLAQEDEAALQALRPNEGIPAWGFRFLEDIPGVKMVLSGMSARAQMEENLRTFQAKAPLTAQEKDVLMGIAEHLKDSVPCTACRYCTPHCPMGLNIPLFLETYNEIKIAPSTNAILAVEALPPEKRPTACIGCGQCEKMCPQHIAIPQELKAFAQKMAQIPSWAEICRQREEAEKKAKEAVK